VNYLHDYKTEEALKLEWNLLSELFAGL